MLPVSEHLAYGLPPGRCVDDQRRRECAHQERRKVHGVADAGAEQQRREQHEAYIGPLRPLSSEGEEHRPDQRAARHREDQPREPTHRDVAPERVRAVQRERQRKGERATGSLECRGH